MDDDLEGLPSPTASSPLSFRFLKGVRNECDDFGPVDAEGRGTLLLLLCCALPADTMPLVDAVVSGLVGVLSVAVVVAAAIRRCIHALSLASISGAMSCGVATRCQPQHQHICSQAQQPLTVLDTLSKLDTSIM